MFVEPIKTYLKPIIYLLKPRTLPRYGSKDRKNLKKEKEEM